MAICKEKLTNFLLCNLNAKLPLNNSHYVCSKDLVLFSKLACIENELSSLTSFFKNTVNSCKNNVFK